MPTSVTRSHISSWLLALAIGIALPLAHLPAGGSLAWLGLGVTAWFVGVAVKIPLAAFASAMSPCCNGRTSASIQGIVSAAAELGVVAVILAVRGARIELIDASLFATAAASTELLVLAGVSLISNPPEELTTKWELSASSSLCVRHLFFLERMVALAGHVGSRGLVILAVALPAPWLTVLAMLGFSLTDGIASYAALKGTDWTDPLTCRRLLVTLGSIACLEILVFVLVLRFLV